MIIFVSYSRKNRGLIDQLVDRLSEMGHTVLYDQQILAGQAWWDKILEDIRACNVFVYALSPEYLDSYPCDLEYRYAAALNRHLLPVMIRSVDFGQVLSDIALTNVLDYSNPDSNESLLKLVRVLNEFSRQPLPPLPAPLPAQPPAPISPLNAAIDKITDFSVTLTRQEQEKLLAAIRRFLYKRETRQNARYALEHFRKRSAFDLAASTAEEIDSLLELSAGDVTPPPAPRLGRTTGRTVAAAVLLLMLVGVAMLVSRTGQQARAPGAVAEVASTVLAGHTDSVQSVAFSPDGKLLASATSGGTVRLWDVKTGTSGTTLDGTAWVDSVAFSPDGSLLASATSGGTVWLWDVATSRARATLRGHAGPVHSVAFSPDGSLLASAGADDMVRLWDVTTGQTRATLRGHTDEVWSVAFSPDGSLLASASADNMVRLWDLTTGQSRATLQGHTGLVDSLAFSPDGKLLASASADNMVRLWDVATGQTRATLQGHTGPVYGVAFSPNGELLASASKDGTVRLWDVATRQTRATLRGHTDGVNSVAFSPDGSLLASGSGDKTVRLWSIPAD